MHHDYFISMAISEMCRKRIELLYKEGYARYDNQTRDMLTKFLDTGKVEACFAPRGHYYKNICYLNKTQQKVTKECCDRFVEDKVSHEVTFKYNGKSETYKIAVGMPMLVTQNLKNENLFNMMEKEITHISGNGILFTNDVYIFDYNIFAQSFSPAFCCTVCKYQGAEIDEQYNIYNVNRMDKKQFYTALSRIIKLEYCISISATSHLAKKSKKPRKIQLDIFWAKYSNLITKWPKYSYLLIY